MIIVDTNIIIDFWKNPSQVFIDIFLNEDVCICGIIKAELLHGARSPDEFNKINDALSEFQYVNIDEVIWDYLGDVLFSLKKGGLTIPFQDALLITIALKNKMAIWTNDKHIKLAVNIFHELQLFQPE